MDDQEPAGSTDALEVDSIARELAAAYRMMVAFHQEQMGLTPVEAEARARGAEPEADLAKERRRMGEEPADQVSWWALGRLAERDPEAVAAGWQRVKDAAKREFASGHRVATALEWGNRPWDRARFLAIRSGFRADWQPHGAIEDALIDVLAQSFDAYLKWTERLTVRAETEGKLEDHQRQRHGEWQPPRMSVAEAIEQAAGMAERAYRQFLTTLKALHDLRRVPAVRIATAGQVNIGSQQVNVATPTKATTSS